MSRQHSFDCNHLHFAQPAEFVRRARRDRSARVEASQEYFECPPVQQAAKVSASKPGRLQHGGPSRKKIIDGRSG